MWCQYLEVLKNLIERGVKIIAIKNLHTKLYLFDNSTAIIGSANFTSGGFGKNVELSVQLKNNPDEIKQLCEYYDNLLRDNKDYEVTVEMINNITFLHEEY